jgi:hypothetical protein
MEAGTEEEKDCRTGGIGSLKSMLGLLKSLKIRSLTLSCGRISWWRDSFGSPLFSYTTCHANMQYIDTTIHRYNDTSIHRYIDSSIHRYIDTWILYYPILLILEHGTGICKNCKSSFLSLECAPLPSPLLANKCLNVPRRGLPRWKKNKGREKD